MNPVEPPPDDAATLGTEVRGPERILRGVGVSPGVALGPIHLHEAGTVGVAEYRIPRDRVEAERARLDEAVILTTRQFGRLQASARDLPGAAGEELGYILDAYQQMLTGSRLVRGAARRITDQRIKPEAAVQQAINEVVAGFAAMADSYLAARVEDVREVGRRLLRNFDQAPQQRPFGRLMKHSLVVAEELTPADAALLDPTRVAGFATVIGGTTSHTAIVARSLGLPAVVGIEGLMGVHPGGTAIVDGTEGLVILDPLPATIVRYRKRRADLLRLRRALRRLREVPAVTRNGTAIRLEANLEFPGEIEGVLAAGAVGVGLLRSEFLFMNRDGIPDEDEQYAALRIMVERLDGKPLTIRTLDVGADKLAGALGQSDSPNPALGLRAIRLSLRRPELLEAQLAAILRAGAHGPVRILLPLVTSVEEVREVRAILDATVRRLRRRKVRLPDPLPPLGVMIEVPGAALSADALAWQSDFFAIGTNDLTQYTLAIDRADEAVAPLYNPLHPAVLRLIQFTAEAGLRAGIPVSICGEIAGDPVFTPLLLGLGIRDLSMAANNIPRVKQRILGLDLNLAARFARRVMEQSDSAHIAEVMQQFETGKIEG